MVATKEEKKEIRTDMSLADALKELAELKKQLDNVCAEVRKLKETIDRHSKNWVEAFKKLFSSVPLQGKKIGEVGSMRIGLIIGIAASALLVCSVFATDVSRNSGDIAHWGSVAIRSDGDIETSGDVNVAGSATVTGTVTFTDISAQDISATGNLKCSSNFTANGAAMCASTLTSTGTITGVGLILGSDITAQDDIIVGGDLTVTGDVTIASGALTDGMIINADLAADSVASNNMVAGDYGDVTVAANGGVTVDDNSLGMTDIAAADYGDITVGADGTVAVDVGSLSASTLDLAQNMMILGGSTSTGQACSVAGDLSVTWSDGTATFAIGDDAISSNSLTAGDYGEVTVAANGGVTVDSDVKTSITNDASQDAQTALKALVWGEPGLTPSTGILTNTVTIQATTLSGTSLVDRRLIHVWASETDMGSASTNYLDSLTLSGGAAVATITAKADYWYVTSPSGVATAVVASSVANTNYLMCADGGSVNSAAIAMPVP